MYNCHGGGGNQFFVFTKTGEIVTILDKCVGVDKQLQLVKQTCTDQKSQMWKYNKKVISRREGGGFSFTFFFALLEQVANTHQKWLLYDGE